MQFVRASVSVIRCGAYVRANKCSLAGISILAGLDSAGTTLDTSLGLVPGASSATFSRISIGSSAN